MQTLILTLFFLVGTGPSSEQQTLWQEFTSNEGRFSASMPDEPKVGTIVTETLEGTLFTRTVSSTDKVPGFLD